MTDHIDQKFNALKAEIYSFVPGSLLAMTSFGAGISLIKTTDIPSDYKSFALCGMLSLGLIVGKGFLNRSNRQLSSDFHTALETEGLPAHTKFNEYTDHIRNKAAQDHLDRENPSSEPSSP